jgi:uncharacterized lipoprotein NlpE involved in copper resistance
MKKVKLSIFTVSLLSLALTMYSCKNTDDDDTTVTPIESVSITSVVQSKYKSAVTVSTSGESIVIKSTGVPDHVTPYWGEGEALYEAPQDGYTTNPGLIRERNFTMTIPTNPASAATKEETTLGAIGMALNGVPIYNDREGGNVPIDAMILTTFDRGGAHVGPTGYHYHVSGDFTTEDDANLVGFLRDGFPIYGRKDMDGEYPTDLDIYGGHTTTTADFPDGIYHYHCSNVNYLNVGVYVLKEGSYYGTKGTFTE